MHPSRIYGHMDDLDMIRDAPDKLSGRIVDFSTIRYPAG